MDILSLLVGLIIICLIWWAISAITGAFGLPAPIVTVIKVVFVIIVVLWLLSALGLWGGGPRFSIR